MILNEFAKYIQTKDNEIITNKSTAINILSEWIKLIMQKTPQTHIEKIIHTEITLAKNKYNEFLIIHLFFLQFIYFKFNFQIFQCSQKIFCHI